VCPGEGLFDSIRRVSIANGKYFPKPTNAPYDPSQMYETSIESHSFVIINVLLVILRSEDGHQPPNMTLVARVYENPLVKSLLASLLRSSSVSMVINIECPINLLNFDDRSSFLIGENPRR
jgi:hypothetical protein